jgi:uncharacterized protein (DUF2236 family)
MTATLRATLAAMRRRPPTGTPGDPGRLTPDSVAGRVNAETRLLLAGPRALLMQLAHPSVAAAVADHSSFRDDPFHRLWGTLELTLAIGYGDRATAADAVARVARTHAAVRGGRDGRPYRASDPELLAWVHATLVDSAIETYHRFVGPMGPGARQRYLVDMRAQAAAFGVPRDRLWPTYPAFRRYVEETVACLDVTEEARALGRVVLEPDVSMPLRPARALVRLATAGMLPEPLRAPYGVAWSDRDERILRASATAVRNCAAVLPDAARRWPEARAAEARLRAAPPSSLHRRTAA